MKKFGWAGKIGDIDLSSGTVEILSTDDFAETYIGGRGIAAKLYWNLVGPKPNAFAPENPLILMTGPLAGTTAPACSRMLMFGVSPLLYPDQCGTASIGGVSASRLKSAGFDGLVIRGAAKRPVLLRVHDGTAELRDAGDLWGLDIPETFTRLNARFGKQAAALCIGPAGERQIRMTLVAGANGSFAGHGFGSVWGAKRLKAVVIEGSGRTAVARPDELTKVNRAIRELIKGREHMDPILPDIELVRRSPCHGCPAGCSRGLYRHASGQEDYRKNCGSSYFYFENDRKFHNDTPSGQSFLATSLCNRVGLCTQELQKMFPWLERCYDESVITEKSSGLKMSTMGSPEFFTDFVEKLIQRKGFADLIAHGTMRAARALGPAAERLLEGIVEKSGFSADIYSPRYFITTALLHATDSNPMVQLHEIGVPAFQWMLWYGTAGSYSRLSTDVLRSIARRFWKSEEAADFSKYEGKGPVAALIQNRQYAKETLIGCDFFYPIFMSEGPDVTIGDPSIESKLLSAVTGLDISEDDYLLIGERAFNLQRLIRAREGCHGRAGDSLPEFNFTEPLETDVMVRFSMFNPEFMLPGPGGELITRKGEVLDRIKFQGMLDEYYRAREWDVVSGMPTAAKLRSLDLLDLISDRRARDLLTPVAGNKLFIESGEEAYDEIPN